jgi:hypothetical protein
MDCLRPGRSFSTISQTLLRSTPSYWWMRNFPQTNNSAPRDLRMGGAVGLIQSLGRFPDDLNVPQYCILNQFILKKTLFSALCEALDLLDSLQDMSEVDARVFAQSGRASFSIRRRSSQ